MHDGKPPVLEFVAIKRKDTSTWAVPSHVSNKQLKLAKLAILNIFCVYGKPINSVLFEKSKPRC